MNKSNEGQASVELMVVLGVLLIIFMLLGYVVYKDYTKSNDLKIYIFGERLANHIADHINTLNAVGDGYSVLLTVPDKLYGGGNYTIDFYRNESSVFIEGGMFSSGSDLKFTSPISTSHVRCIMDNCNYTCNSTNYGDCLRVDRQMTIRLARYDGGVYLTPEHNVIQAQTAGYINPFEGVGEVDPGQAGSEVKTATDSAGRWSVIYVHHNLASNTLSLVFNINLTNNEMQILRLHNVIGDIVNVTSKEGGATPEFDLAADPQAQWLGNSTGKIEGGTIIFKGGFHVCIEPDKTNMPTQNWTVLSSDGNNIQLDKTKEVCVSYP